MIGLTQVLAETFRSLHTRIVKAPWTGPGGETWELEIRVHDDPSYQESLAALKIDPLSTTERERKRPQISALQGLTGQSLSDEDKATADSLDREQEEIVSIGFPWQTYPATYTLAEVDKAAPAVRRDLVVGAWELGPPGEDGSVERVVATEEEVTQWFLSDRLIPRQFPEAQVATSSPLQALAKNLNGRNVYLAGEREGVAIAAFVLRESVQEHLFKERLDPLSNGSASTPGGAPTIGAKPAPPPASEQSSPKTPGDVSEASAQDPTSCGSTATAEPVTGSTTSSAAS